jgi:cytochrome c553
MTILGYHVMLRTVLLAAVLGVALTSAGYADELQAKLAYCKTCHGLSGQGYHGYYTMPRLAGQQPKYIENQLRAFIEHRRKNQIMANVAHVLSPSMLSALANHFRNLNPPPRENGFSRRDFPNPTSPHVPPATVRTPRGRTRSLAWPGSFLTTSTTNW